MLASFEKTTDHLFNAAFNARRDPIQGVSECIILVRPPPPTTLLPTDVVWVRRGTQPTTSVRRCQLSSRLDRIFLRWRSCSLNENQSPRRGRSRVLVDWSGVQSHLLFRSQFVVLAFEILPAFDSELLHRTEYILLVSPSRYTLYALAHFDTTSFETPTIPLGTDGRLAASILSLAAFA